VGYMEDDPIRGDDSWQTFDEVMTLAKKHDVCISSTKKGRVGLAK